MIKFKKFLAAVMTGAMMFGVVATAAPVASVYAADASSNYTILVDYESFRAAIYTAEANATAYVTLEVVKDEAGTKPGTKYTYPVSKLDLEIDENDTDNVFKAADEQYGVIVDLSFLKISKKAYIRAQGNGEAAPTAVKTINAQFKKPSVKYTSGKADDKWYEAFTIDKTPLKAAPEEGVYQYRTLYGSEFTDLTNFAKAKATAEIAGTTLIVRKAAKQANDDTAGVLSAEVKVKVPAAPKAPKVAVDYVKNIVKLPKGAKYAVLEKGETEPSDWATAAEKGESLSPAEILVKCKVVGDDTTKPDADVLAAGFSIVVYTPASGKKGDSLCAIVSIPKTESPEEMDGEGKIAVNDKVYATLKKTDTGFDLTATGADFGYALDSADSTKWTTIKAGATKAINMTKDTDGKLYVRAMGNKSEGTLPTDAVEVSWYKITSIEVKVTPEEVTLKDENQTVTVTYEVKAIGDTSGLKDEDGKIDWKVKIVADGLTVAEGGKITIAKTTAAKEYTVTVTSDLDATVKGTKTLTVKAAEEN